MPWRRWSDEWLELPWSTAAVNANPANDRLKRWHYAARVMRSAFRTGTRSVVAYGDHDQLQVEFERESTRSWGNLYFHIGYRSGAAFMDTIGLLPSVLTE